MYNVKLGNKIFSGVKGIKMDTEDGGTVVFEIPVMDSTFSVTTSAGRYIIKNTNMSTIDLSTLSILPTAKGELVTQ